MLFAHLWGEGQPAKATLTVDDASPGDPQLEGAAAEGKYGRWPGRSSLPQIPRWAPPLHQLAPPGSSPAGPGPGCGDTKKGKLQSSWGAMSSRLCRGWGCGAGHSTARAAGTFTAKSSAEGLRGQSGKGGYEGNAEPARRERTFQTCPPEFPGSGAVVQSGSPPHGLPLRAVPVFVSL